MGRDVELVFGEEREPKWEAWKIFGLEVHAASNTKAQRIILGNSHQIQETGTPKASSAPSGRK